LNAGFVDILTVAIYPPEYPLTNKLVVKSKLVVLPDVPTIFPLFLTVSPLRVPAPAEVTGCQDQVPSPFAIGT
jgi:hypothetical protein